MEGIRPLLNQGYGPYSARKSSDQVGGLSAPWSKHEVLEVQ